MNVSAKQFHQAGFVAQVQAAGSHHAINPARLNLELTEGMLLEGIEDTIAMARGLNLDVIAEGVETEQQRQLLLDNGCMHYQGYLFGKPVPIEQFEAQLEPS